MDGVVAIEDIWAYCADEREDGDLSGMSNSAIVGETEFDGDPDELIAALTTEDFKLLDGEEGNYRVHDWAEHNPYVASHNERSERARNAGIASGKVRKNKSKNTPNSNSNELPVQSSSTQTNSSEQTVNGNEQTVNPIPISDSVSNSRSFSKTKKTNTVDCHNKNEILEIFDHYKTYHPSAAKSPNSSMKVWGMIKARLTKDGFTVEQLKQAVDGLHKDDWVDRHKYLELKHAVKDSDTVTRMIEIANGSQKKEVELKVGAEVPPDFKPPDGWYHQPDKFGVRRLGRFSR